MRRSRPSDPPDHADAVSAINDRGERAAKRSDEQSVLGFSYLAHAGSPAPSSGWFVKRACPVPSARIT